MSWLSGWSKRVKITLTEAGNGTYAECPTQIDVAYDPIMKNDFADCRFTEDNGTTLIPYGIQSKTDGVTCKFVIVRDYVALTPQEIYLYYGNSEALDASVPYESWVTAWYMTYKFGGIQAYTNTTCATYGRTASGTINAWAGDVYGAIAVDGAHYCAFYGRVKINGDPVKWASTEICNGQATWATEKFGIYAIALEQKNHGSWIKDALNTVTLGHYQGGTVKYYCAWTAEDPVIVFGEIESGSGIGLKTGFYVPFTVLSTIDFKVGLLVRNRQSIGMSGKMHIIQRDTLSFKAGFTLRSSFYFSLSSAFYVRSLESRVDDLIIQDLTRVVSVDDERSLNIEDKGRRLKII